MTTVTSFAEQRIQQINQRIMSFTRLLEIIKRFSLYAELKESRPPRRSSRKCARTSRCSRSAPTSSTAARADPPGHHRLHHLLRGQEPQTVQQVANVLVSLFLGENLRERVKQVAETSEFLESELVKLREELAVQESRLAEYKGRHINELPELLNANTQILNSIERSLETNSQQLRSLREREGYFQAQLSGLKPRSEKEEELAGRKAPGRNSRSSWCP